MVKRARVSKRVFIGYLAVAALAAFLMSMTVGKAPAATTLRAAAKAAQVGGDPSTQLVGYYDLSETASDNGTGAGDNILELINPTGANGDLCAMIYVFDDDEQMGECCGCALTPNDTLLLSFQNDLTTNWREASGDFENGIVQIISADQNASSASCDPAKACNGGCDPSIAYVPAPELNGGITKPQRIGNLVGITETPLIDNGTAGQAEQGFLIAQCANIVANGSRRGICSCGPKAQPGAPTSTATSTSLASATRTPTATATSTSSASGTPTATASASPSATSTASPTATATDTATATTTASPSATPTATDTATATASPTATDTATATATETAIATTTATATDTATATATDTATATPTATATGMLVPAVTLCPPVGATPVSSPGSSGNYTVLAGASVTNTGSTTITGNLGISPGAAAPPNVTGSPGVSGFTDDSNGNSLNGENILGAAITDAAGRAVNMTIANGELGGLTLVGGVYKSGISSFMISASDLTLDAQGDPSTVWIFQMPSSTLTTVTGNVVLTNGALGCNVFWQVGSSATLGTNTTFYGNIMATTSITMATGATIPQGRALAQNGSDTFDTNTIGGCVCP